MRQLLYLHEHAAIGGGERSLLALWTHLDRGRFLPHLLCPADGPLPAAAAALGVRCHPVAIPRLRGWLTPHGVQALRRVLAVARAERAELLHGNTPKTNLLAAWAGRRLGIPIVWQARNLLLPGQVDLEAWLARIPDRIICNSEAVARRFRGRQGARVRVIHNGVDLARVRPGLSGEGLRRELGLGDEPLVGMVANFSPVKRHEVFLRACAAVRAACPSARFALIGDEVFAENRGRRAALEGLAASLGLGASVHFLGFRQEMPEVLAALDVFVLTSHPEACSRAILEAMAAGRAVVAVAAGGNPELVQDGISGRLVPPNDPAAVAEAVLGLLQDPHLMSRMGTAARQRAEEAFDVRTMARRMATVYDELLGPAQEMPLPVQRPRGGSTPFRVGIDVRELERGAHTGIGRHLRNLLDLPRYCPDVALVAYANQHTDARTVSADVLTRTLRERWRPWWDQVTLPQAIRRDRPDVFLSPYYKAPLAAPCPVVITIHDLIPLIRPEAAIGRAAGWRWAFRLACRAMARRAALVLTDSEFSRAELIQTLGIPAGKIRIVHPGVGAEFHPDQDPARVRAVLDRYGIPPDPFLFVGNFRRHKNLPRLLQAWARLPEALRRRHRLVLAGAPGAEGESIGRHIAELDLSGQVRCLGPVPDEDLPGLYAGSLALVLPSLVEGFGLPAAEAMACGTPVIASTAGALPEVLGEAGITVDPRDVGALAAALEKVACDDDLRQRLRAIGPRRAERFRPEATLPVLGRLLGEAAGVDR